MVTVLFLKIKLISGVVVVNIIQKIMGEKGQYLALMQPYFFPYIGYFSLVAKADLFLFFDNAQFIKGGWVNKNKIISNRPCGWTHINIPIRKHPHDTLIKAAKIANDDDWQKKIKNQIRFYQSRSAFFEEIYQLIDDILSYETSFVSDFNTNVIRKISDYLELNCRFESTSSLESGASIARKAGEHAVYYCEMLGYKNYINPPGAIDEIFDIEQFRTHNIGLFCVRNNILNDAKMEVGPFSIIDDLFLLGKDKVRQRIFDFELIDKTRAGE